ncbi:MAG: hypothetical protein RIA08_09895 [Roseovarius sp.]|uniref:tellurite resistance TerB family protein n=1 Tax=Roseovarius sp. TaxID=1486281 RepID=UPI0032EBC879
MLNFTVQFQAMDFRMILLKWLAVRAPAVETPPPALPEIKTRPHVPPPVSDHDHAEMITLEKPKAEGQADLEPVYCIIDYCDADGNKTRRRITLLKMRTGPNAPMLTAICHERRAMRTFRCDRIECFISDVGEIIETDAFFRETMYLNIADFYPAGKGPGHEVDPAHAETLRTAKAVRDALRFQLRLLVSAARCDEVLHPAELDVICRYIEDEIEQPYIAERYGRHVTIEVLDQLASIMSRSRPYRESLPTTIDAIARLDDDQLDRLTGALRDVILADGKVVAEETMLISEVRALRSAIDGVYWPELGLPETEWS